MGQKPVVIDRPNSIVRPVVSALLFLLIIVVLSISLGTLPVSLRQVWNALTDFNPEIYEHRVVRDLRIPRTILGLVVGMALALSGAGIQGITRNPLADPSILGINSGAAFAIIIVSRLTASVHPQSYFWAAFVGGLLALMVVMLIASMGGGLSPSKLVLAGVVVSSLLSAWSSAVLILNQETLDSLRFWLVGSISGRSIRMLPVLLPFLITGTAGLLIIGGRINILSMGDDRAQSLGMNTARLRGFAAIFAVFLAASSVALAGPIGFVGLAVPHLIRRLGGAQRGSDYRFIFALSIFLGPAFLLSADIGGRLLAAPSEIQVGIITALAGAPVLIAIAQGKRLFFS